MALSLRRAMAGRRYVRDNRGRFATVGATARGGRLATSAGNQRATVTGKIEGAVPRSTVRPGRRRSKPAAPAVAAPSSSRQRVRGNFRPQNTMAKPPKTNARFGKDATQNLAAANQVAKAKGASLQPVAFSKQQVRSGTKAYVLSDKQGVVYPTVYVNKDSKYWNNPRAVARAGRRSGQFSTSAPEGVILHEVGHIKAGVNLGTFKGADRRRPTRQPPTQQVARRVSKYAAESPAEFVAETYAGRRTGRRYDHQVMNAYHRVRGTRPRSVRSQIKPR